MSLISTWVETDHIFEAKPRHMLSDNDSDGVFITFGVAGSMSLSFAEAERLVEVVSTVLAQAGRPVASVKV